MSLNSDCPSTTQTRKYRRQESIVFLKTREAFGGLSNMAGGVSTECQQRLHTHIRSTISGLSFSSFTRHSEANNRTIESDDGKNEKQATPKSL